MARKLRVYRTPIGFHDAYVAAPSQKAALAAWGADANLFARGVAEEVTDEALTAAPLANPGTIVKLARGTAAEHLAALPEDPPKPPPGADEARKPARRAAKPKPRPDRSALDAAEQAVDGARVRHDDEIEDLRGREAELQRERREAETRRDADIAALEDVADKARSRYEAAMRKWKA